MTIPQFGIQCYTTTLDHGTNFLKMMGVCSKYIELARIVSVYIGPSVNMAGSPQKAVWSLVEFV